MKAIVKNINIIDLEKEIENSIINCIDAVEYNDISDELETIYEGSCLLDVDDNDSGVGYTFNAELRSDGSGISAISRSFIVTYQDEDVDNITVNGNDLDSFIDAIIDKCRFDNNINER